MLSTLSPLFSAEPLLVSGGGFGCASVFSSSHGGFTPWENIESSFASFDCKSDSDLNEPNLSHSHGHAGSGSDLDPDLTQKPHDFDQACGDNHDSPNQTSTLSSSGSDDPNQNSPVLNFNSGHGDDGERKRKRKVSNRESARRSRMRKQSHVENLRTEATRLKLENEEGKNRLRLMSHNIHLIRSDNDRLRVESVILQRKLMELNQIWQLQQLQRNNNNNHDARPCIRLNALTNNLSFHDKSLYGLYRPSSI